MLCRICLEKSNKYINFFDDGLKFDAANIIGKHFWFYPKPNDNISNTICLMCWRIIEEFHELYTRAKKANDNWILKLESKNGSLCFDNVGNLDNHIPKDNAENSEKVETSSIVQIKTEYETLCDKSEKKITSLEEEVNASEKIEPRPRKKSARLSNTKANQEISAKIIKANKNNSIIANAPLTKNTTKRNQKRTNEQKAAFTRRVAEGDLIIAKFTEIFCNICSLQLPSFTTLKTHCAFVHKEKGYVVCCEKKYYKRSRFVDHIEKHVNPEKYKCKICNKISMDRWTLNLHMKNVHKDIFTEALSYNCSHCGKGFRLKSVMLRHELIHVPESERKFKCNLCEKSYPSQGTLNHHVRTYHDRRYSGMCDICGKTYNNRQDVKRHKLEVHEGAERLKFKCKYCNLLFRSKYIYYRHKFEEHEHRNQDINHKCSFCDKILSNSQALKSHIQYAHKTQLKFQCPLCGKNFKRELVLKEHMAAHTGEPLYVCPHCPKTFTHSSNMHHHRKRVHPIEFENARLIKDGKKESWCKLTALKN